MKDEKRIIRTYKVKPSIYKKAMRRARKDGTTVSNLLEDVLTGYSSGLEIRLGGMGKYTNGYTNEP